MLKHQVEEARKNQAAAEAAAKENEQAKADAEQKASDSAAQYQSAQEQLASAKAENEKLAQDLEEARKNQAAAESNAKENEQAKADAEQKASDSAAQYQHALEQLAVVNAENGKLRQELDEAKAAPVKAADDLKAQLEEARKYQANAEANAKENEQVRMVAEQRAYDAEKRIEALQEENAELKVRIENAENAKEAAPAPAPTISISAMSAPAYTPAQAAAPAAVPEQPQTFEEPAEEEEGFDKDAALSALGIEPETPETFVRRASWNKGLRCRRDYGKYKIPVAFVKGKVAVFIDGDEPVTSKDEPLAREGWTVFHFAASDITDGEAQATVIDEAVKANIKASKKPKRKNAAKKN